MKAWECFRVLVCLILVALSAEAWCRTPTLFEVNPEFQPYLYQVSVPESSQDVFLLGTQHNIPLDRFPKIVEWVAERCDVFVTEIEYLSSDKNAFVGSYSWLTVETLEQLELYRKEGFGWIHRIDSDYRKFLNKKIAPLFWKQWRVDLSQIHPLLIEEFLNDEIETANAGRGIDQELSDLFESRKKSILGLETDRDRHLAANSLLQMAYYARDFDFVNSRYFRLYFMIEMYKYPEPEDVQNLSIAQIKEYASGDLSQSYFPGDSSIGIRNKNWIPRIEEILKKNSDKTVLIAVGVAHLPGKEGVIQLLVDKGYSVRQITREGAEAPISETSMSGF